MSLDGYYDHHAARVPRVPISLIGFLGADQEKVGTLVGSLTALGFTHVPHLVAHRVGASVRRIVADRGEGAYRALEDECMKAALADRPAGIVSLGDGALLDPRSRAHVVESSVLVYLHYDPEELAAKIRRRLESDPAHFYPWIRGQHVCGADLEVLFEERRPGYEEATVQLEATGRPAVDVARDLIEQLEL